MSKPEAYSIPSSIMEDEMSEECRNILATLPKEMGWDEKDFCQYQGFWHPLFLFKYVPACQKHFQAHDSDIIIASNPKCGTTWLKSLAFAIQNRMRYLPTDKQHPLLTKNSHVLVRSFEYYFDFDKRMPDGPSPSTFPRLFATHLPYISLPNSVKLSACKIIYIARNPKDNFISLWHFMNKLRAPEMGSLSIEEALEKFCRGVSPIGPFWDHVLGYWKKSMESPDKVMFLKYEELKKEPNFHVKRISEFMGCPFSKEEEASGIVDDIVNLCSFNNLSNLEVNKSGISPDLGKAYNIFFRVARAEDWKNYLTPDMADRLDRLTAEKFHEFGLKL